MAGLDADRVVAALNDVATMRELGRRLGTDLDPLAYTELLAERLERDRPGEVSGGQHAGH